MTPEVGTRLSGWTLIRELPGAGAPACRVFEASGPAGRAALKVFEPAAQSSAAREVAALASVSHPGIVRLLEHGALPPWTATEWIDGRRLDDALDAAHSTAALAQLLGALAHLHARGLVHGDLRPANVLVERSGRLVLLDLGLASRTQAASGPISGTPLYMAPERLAGGPPSPAADLHACGAIMIACLAGETALATAREGGAGTLALAAAAMPIAPLLGELVAREVADRPASAAEALGRLLALLPAELPAHLAHLPSDARLATPSPGAELGEPPLVGRDAALAQLGDVLAATRDGRGAFVHVAADPGLGRTRLLQEVARQAESLGMRALRGRCRAEGIARGPWRDVLSVLAAELATRNAGEVAELVTADARALGLACPEMLELPYVRSLPDPPDLSPDLNKFRLFSAMTGLLRSWSRREPIVLLIDDVQWADDATLELLYYLQRNVVHGAATFGEPGAGGALSIVLTGRRGGEAESDLLEKMLADARRGGHLEIQLQRLSGDHVRGLVAGMLPGAAVPAELTELVAAESAGSPQVAVELVRSLHADGLVRRVRGEWRFHGAESASTGRLADMLRRRLDRAGEAGRRLLRVAAVMGHEADLAVAADAAGLDATQGRAAADDLQAARLVVPGTAQRHAFVHEQLRQLLLEETEPQERAALHLAVASALERTSSRSPRGLASELARHYVAGGDVAGALRHLPAAASERRAAGNPAEALALLRSHVALFEKLPRDERHRRTEEALAARQAIAEILQRSGHYDDATAAWLDLIGSCRGAKDPSAEARALVGLGMTCNLAGAYAEAHEHLDRALALAIECGSRRAIAGARTYLVQNAYMRGRFEEGERHVAALRDAVGTLDDRALTADALRQIGLFHHVRGRSEEAVPLYREALELLTEMGDRATMAATLHNLGILHNARGEYHVAMDCYERSLAIFREMGLRVEQAKCLSNIGNVHLQQGAATEAERCYLEAQVIYRDLQDRRSEAENLSNLGEVETKRGQYLQARERHRQALAVHRDLGNPAGIGLACYELAMTHLALGRLDEAAGLVAEALDRDRELGNPRGLAYDLAASALLHRLRGDDTAALEECGNALAEARRAGDRYHAAILLDDIAAILLDLDRPREAHARASQAHLEATSLGAREAEVLALLTLARTSSGEQARDRLARALELVARTENPQVAWRAWHCAALMGGAQGRRDARAAMDRAVEIVATVARKLGDESAGFLARRDVRGVLDDALALEERAESPRAEVLLARYHLLASEEQRARARQILSVTIASSPAEAGELRRLRAFHEVVTSAGAFSLDSLLQAFMERILQAVDAERGLLFLVKGRQLSCRVALARGGGALAAPEREVPRQVVEWVLRERTGLITEDVASDPRVAWRGSVADLRVKSLMAAPLPDVATPGRPALGVVYVDRRASGTVFGPQARQDFEATCDDLARLVGLAQRLEEREIEQRLPEGSAEEGLPGMLGVSPLMRQLFATARIVAGSTSSVLVTGQSGTGKEGLARALHALSPRANGPFVALDCGSVPGSLIESVLFGHVRGAFTGADRDRAGIFEEAHGGSLFLDEVGNASPDFQSRLLRVLQEREVRRVGGRGTLPVDVRVVAASNVDLEAEVAAGRFRQDLYYRLDVIHLHLPPLSERREDIPLLAEHVLRQVVAREGRPLEGFTEDALRVLAAHSWPGNVRELTNCVARMAAFCAEGRVGSERIPEAIRNASSRALEVRPLGEADDETAHALRIVQTLSSGQADFWSAIRGPLKERTMTRSLAREVVAEGLRRADGSYRAVARLFGLSDSEYGRFMDYLRFNQLKLDFREYRPKK